MSDFEVERTRLFAGSFEAVVRDVSGEGKPPSVIVTHQGEVIAHELSADPARTGQWNLRLPVPVERLSDGVQVFLVRDADTGERLAAFTLLSGEPLEDDIRAELELLRAELDMLKRAFRQHCRDSG